MKLQVYTITGEAKGHVEVSDAIFGREWNGDLVHQVVLAEQANARLPWAHAKGRGEVRGGGIKPWKQKGTGRARHGSIRSPIWKGGGVSHGPVKTRDYSQKINKKMARQAFFAALSKKVTDGEVRVVDSFDLKAPKTKELAMNLKQFFKAKQIPSTLLVAPAGSTLLVRASRNIPKVDAASAKSMTVYELLSHRQVVIEEKAIADIK